jgi:hypothetical protein
MTTPHSSSPRIGDFGPVSNSRDENTFRWLPPDKHPFDERLVAVLHARVMKTRCCFRTHYCLPFGQFVDVSIDHRQTAALLNAGNPKTRFARDRLKDRYTFPESRNFKILISLIFVHYLELKFLYLGYAARIQTGCQYPCRPVETKCLVNNLLGQCKAAWQFRKNHKRHE